MNELLSHFVQTLQITTQYVRLVGLAVPTVKIALFWGVTAYIIIIIIIITINNNNNNNNIIIIIIIIIIIYFCCYY
jgi:hypothetical protein